jgi:6-pyruvoyltetrahydropterin/6-carboxytetrahydropterin synthase
MGTALFQLRVVTDFAASHILHGHPGKCARLHGHNWQVEVVVAARQLDAIGMALDFQDIKAATRRITDELDHRHLNDLPAFEGVNPTAEHVAGHIHRALSQALNQPGIRVESVTIWETPRSSVRYSEPP